MIPILYEKDEIAFISNGLCRLRDCISCIVTEERNGIYECDFEYPIDGANFDYIIPGRIVGVTHDDTGDVQPFDIVGYSRPIDGIVTFHCVHISYRLSEACFNATAPVNSLTEAMAEFAYRQLTGVIPFTFTADFKANGYASAFSKIPQSARRLLGGVEGSVLDAYGGEYEWDKWNVRLLKSRGEYKDFSIRYGVNMLAYNEDYDSSGCYSSCRPYWTDGTTLVVGDEQTNGGITPSGRNVCVPLDVSDKFESLPTKAQVEAMGLLVMNQQNPTIPAQNIKVSFVRLQDFPEYEGFENLLKCKLCDTIKVIFPDYNSSADFKIVKTVWNVLESRYDEMELGDLSVTLADVLGISSKTTEGYNGDILTSSSLVVETHTFSDTFTANTYTSVTSDFTKTGYYPLGIVGYSLTGTNSSYLSFSRCYLSARDIGECTFLLRARNIANNDSTPTINVDILWMKAGQSPNVMIYQDIDTKVLYMR